jgi:hypothetical protein
VATTASKRAKNHTALANSKKDTSPKWDNADMLSGEQFTKLFRDSMNWYSQNKTGKELKPQVINWLGSQGIDKTLISEFKRTKDAMCGITLGAVAACLVKGMPRVHPEFNNGKDSGAWVITEVMKIVSKGDFTEPEPQVVVKTGINPIITIQDRIREQAGAMCEEIDAAIDNFIMDPEGFDPKQYNLVKLLRGKGAKAAQGRYIKSFYEFGHNELLELSSGKADEQLREAYRHLPRKQVKKLIDFYQFIMDACDQIAAEAKVNKKPRAKKTKPAEDIVKKLKFRTSDDKLGIVSVPPAQIVKAQSVLVYNIKNRKIGLYVSLNSEGLGVKGTSLTNFTDKSIQKTLRKPLEQLKELKDQNTQKRVETWFAKSIKTTETKLNGRLNEDTVILRVYK